MHDKLGEEMKTEKIARLATVALILVATAFFITSCTKVAKKKDKVTIGAVLRYESSPYFRDIEAGLRETADKKGARVIVLAPDQKNAGSQGVLLQRLMELKSEVLIFSPDDEVSCIPAIIQARTRGIPVIFLSPAIAEQKLKDAGVKVNCEILCDQKKGGKKAALYMAEKLKGKGLVAVIEGMPTNANIVKRTESFRQTLATFPGIKVISVHAQGFNEHTAFMACSDLLRKKAGISGIFAVNDVMALGAAEALIAAKKKDIPVIGFDATVEGLTAVREKRIDATVNQFPYDMGKMATEIALKCIKGEEIPPFVLIEPEMITSETVQLPFH
jgi:ribose transport system substrate-binding protein